MQNGIVTTIGIMNIYTLSLITVNVKRYYDIEFLQPKEKVSSVKFSILILS